MEKKYTLYITDDVLTNYPIASSKSLEIVRNIATAMGYILRDEDADVIRFTKQYQTIAPYLDGCPNGSNITWYAYIRK